MARWAMEVQDSPASSLTSLMPSAVTDDTDAINMAASSGYRCGEDCGSSSTLGALVYFPSGTYRISAPIVQYYYTQFVGNPKDRPVIKGSADFSGIALFDSDVYIPEGSGAEWVCSAIADSTFKLTFVVYQPESVLSPNPQLCVRSHRYE